ncbi:MAG: glycosyltransferase [Candidatus Omnitrophica bacterium]|nr:glycosyltransferase [Candidatus Omnitrophota bacterium]
MIIPVLQDAKTIHATLEELFLKHDPEEVIVVDGGSTDRTREVASEWTKVLNCPGGGRARQMNAGADAASGDVLLFLFPGTKLPAKGLEKVKHTLAHGAHAGRFRMGFDNPQWFLKLYSSYTRFHFFSNGDEGFFIRRPLFHQMYGFREDVPHEGIDFYRRLRKLIHPVILKDPVITFSGKLPGIQGLKERLIRMFIPIPLRTLF